MNCLDFYIKCYERNKKKRLIWVRCTEILNESLMPRTKNCCSNLIKFIFYDKCLNIITVKDLKSSISIYSLRNQKNVYLDFFIY